MYFDVIARGRRPYGLSMFQNIWCFGFQEDFVIQNLLDVGRTCNLTPEIGRPFSSVSAAIEERYQLRKRAQGLHVVPGALMQEQRVMRAKLTAFVAFRESPIHAYIPRQLRP